MPQTNTNKQKPLSCIIIKHLVPIFVEMSHTNTIVRTLRNSGSLNNDHHLIYLFASSYSNKNECAVAFVRYNKIINFAYDNDINAVCFHVHDIISFFLLKIISTIVTHTLMKKTQNYYYKRL